MRSSLRSQFTLRNSKPVSLIQLDEKINCCACLQTRKIPTPYACMRGGTKHDALEQAKIGGADTDDEAIFNGKRTRIRINYSMTILIIPITFFTLLKAVFSFGKDSSGTHFKGNPGQFSVALAHIRESEERD